MREVGDDDAEDGDDRTHHIDESGVSEVVSSEAMAPMRATRSSRDGLHPRVKPCYIGHGNWTARSRNWESRPAASGSRILDGEKTVSGWVEP
jgi:hypothetical protein